MQQDLLTIPRSEKPATRLPVILEPSSLWRAPVELPALSGEIAIDLETYDPYLRQTGPSYKRNEGFVVGIAIADKDHTLYLPFAHQGGDNLPKNLVLQYVSNQIKNADCVLFANALYDMGWLSTLGISIDCTVRDIQVAEALIDEEQFSYSLNTLSLKYLNRPKDETHLKNAAEVFGVDPKAGLWKLAARHVGIYAEIDARNTWDIYQHQKPILIKESLTNIWELECKVTKVLLSMTLKGVPVDLIAAEIYNDELKLRENKLSTQFGNLDIWSPQQLGDYCENTLKIKVPRTEKGNYSVDKFFLQATNNTTLLSILELRSINRLRKVFIEDIILKQNYKGKIHADFKQTASERGGTRSGRLSSSNPNMQQVPKRSDIGKKIRSLYIAEPDMLWCKADYSSQEPRLQVHYALLGDINTGKPLPKAEDARAAFAAGEKLYTFFEKETGLPYDTCKMICLGISYGMGNKKMAAQLDISEDECKVVIEKFNAKAPFLRILFDSVMLRAKQKGEIKTILGRKAHFDFWMPSYDDKPVKGYDNATKKYKDQIKNLQRAFISKGLNRLIQGSAADQTKLAMVLAHDAGFDLRLPVHDEINAMVSTEAEAKALGKIMEEAIKLKVPVVADIDLGPTWC
jgi:DNA polymerase I-like protein with 3'-5' exonuclease and polymerase domains